MWTIRTFSVAPLLPNRLKRLEELARNLWWCWNPDSFDLFRRLDADAWERTEHNPVALLGELDQERLKAASEDDGFLSHMERVLEAYDEYMNDPRWYQRTYADSANIAGEPVKIAYFSAEFGLTDCLPIYSGGLGILAGDHLKSASDLGLPLAGIGLMYSHGYFRQYLNADGWQQESYPNYDFANTPAVMCRRDDGSPLTIEVEFPEHRITALIWKVQVGRVTLYLMDTNVPSNNVQDREITARLYGGDLEMRIKQEILLGIGGMQVLESLKIKPAVCHMNEGHSAFLSLERIRRLMEEKGLSFNEAREATVNGNIFTTHTPVPAGNDMFPASMMDKYFTNYFPRLGLSRKQFLALGRQNPKDENEPFSMTVLAIHLATYKNGVSKLHGEVSRQMWQRVYSDLPINEVPIDHITNGIHSASWTSKDMSDLLDRYLGPKWRDQTDDKQTWQRIYTIPDAELWRTHERRRERLVAFARRQLHKQLMKRGATKTEIAHADEVLDPEALTIGFARRFATYKRGTLLLRDVERLKRMLNDHDRPVQMIFAGKAHPRDTEGKDLIRQIVHLARLDEFRRKIVFLEDYDMNVARYLVQGVDVWMNTPRRPMEASGTSGMKVCCNGALNLSILDGWWVEGYNMDNGWAIGSGEVYEDWEYQDQVEGQSLYDTLEKEVVPLFYDRGADDLPRKWVERMKNSMAGLCPTFTTHRMVRDYAEKFYMPATKGLTHMMEDNFHRSVDLAKWKQRLLDGWAEIRIENVEQSEAKDLAVGSCVEVRANVRLGNLVPDDVTVELYTGTMDGHGRLNQADAIAMTCTNSAAPMFLYAGKIPCKRSGMHGFGVRILPKNGDMPYPYDPGLILWA